jgi:hypothetical protein
VGFSLVGLTHRVERAGAIASKDHGPGRKNLDRETKGIKFYRAEIVSGKFSNRNKIFDNMGNNEYVAEEKRMSERLNRG